MSQTQLLIACDACGGLVPAGRATCLHCARAVIARPGWARLFQLLAGGGFLMTLAACYGAPYRYHPSYAEPVDTDRDGASVPDDCDDTDPRRYPGAADPVNNGVDEDCDGLDGPRRPAVIAEPPSP
jgi:hypothetical protein